MSEFPFEIPDVLGGRQRKHMVDEFRELLVRCGEDVCGFVL